MLLGGEKKFILKQAKNKGAKALFDGFSSIVESSGVPINEESVEYLKLFVQYDYKECIRIVREKENKHFTVRPYECDYLHYLGLISAYYLDRGEYIKGLLWAMKAIEICNLLYTTMDKERKHEILNKKAVAEFYWQFYPKYPIQDLYNSFHLEWEIKEGLHLDYNLRLNDNSPA